jgi:hypothetical protein
MKRILAILALCAAYATVASAADPFVGTYKLNPAKSRMSGGTVAKALTLVIAEEGDNLIITTNGTNGEGGAIAGKISAPKKGGDVRVLEGKPAYDSATVTRTSSNAVQMVTMRQGKEGVRVQMTLSPDGKVLTRTVKGTNASGQQVDGVSVLERQ